MVERMLLSVNDAARTLGISRTHFYRLLPTLRALGLREKWLGKRRRYPVADLSQVIERLEGDGMRRRRAPTAA